MKRLIAALATALFAVGCGASAIAPTAPSAVVGVHGTHTTRHLHAVVTVPAPGSFVAGSLNTATDETIGVAGVSDPTVDVLDTVRPWVDIPTGATTYEPGNSITAAAYSNDPAKPLSKLLPGSQFEIDWNTAAVQGNGTGFSYFDPITVTFGGATHTYTNADRNVTLNSQGAQLVVNSDTNGLTCLTLTLPGGALYMVAGLRF